MPSPMTMSAPAGGGTASTTTRQGTPPPVTAPFTRGAYHHDEPFIDDSTTLAATTTRRGPFDVISYGYFRHLVLLVQATGGTGTAVTSSGDAPWDALQEVILSDVNGSPIVGPLNGYDLYVMNKYGGYAWMPDPNQSPAFSLIGTTTGNFSFLLRVPVEIVERDALGVLPNQNAASTYKLSWTWNTLANIYGTTVPSTPPSARMRVWLEAFSQPTPTDLRGQPQATVPPAMGTTQFWSKFTKTISPGFQTIQLPRVGNLIRNLVFMLYSNATPSIRDTADFPDPIQILWDGRILLNEARVLRQHYMTEKYDYAGAIGGLSGAAVVQLDTGVFVYPFTDDMDQHPGGELRDWYIPTTQATRLEISGTWGAASQLFVCLTNDVAPAGEVVAAD